MKIKQSILIAVDAIVFGYKENKLHVLLIKQKFGDLKNQWALVGGFVKNKETLDEAIYRELKEETGIKVTHLEQLYTFSDIDRDPRGRVISIAYFGLVNPKELNLVAGSDAEETNWFSLDSIPTLAFDHQQILATALLRLKAKLSYEPIGFDLLPKEFLFSELETLYSTILQKEVDRRNFRKKLMNFGFIEETEKYASQKSGRPAKLFTFNKKKYKELIEKDFLFEIKLA